MGKSRQNPEVIVAGGGPVGLGLALDLARQGVASLVLERATRAHRIPRGQNLTQRTGEHFRAWGISEAVRKASPVPPQFGNAGIVIYEKLLGEYHYDWFQRSAVRQYYFADNERLPQYELEAVLRRRLRDFEEITLVEGAKVTGVEQDAHGVTVAYQTEAGTCSAAAPFAVGCDGARSRVREAAGITSDIDHEGPKMVLLVFRSMALHRLLEHHPGKSIFNVMNPKMGGYWQFLGRVDLRGGWFYHSPVPHDVTKDNFDFHAHLHEMVGCEFELEFEHIGFWDLRISLANSYRAARVFIAGDACHSHPPYGGYGVNTGFEDARNLSWKLAAALRGWAGEGLLDSYTTERRPVFESVSQDFIARMIDDFGRFTHQYSPHADKAKFEAAWRQRANADDTDVTEFLPHYAGSPLVFGKAGDVSGAKGKHSFAAKAGYHLAPQPLPEGRELWDELGRGFTLLNFATPQVGASFKDAAAKRGIPLKITSITSRELANIYGAEAILVRPDQFIAWAGRATEANAGYILNRAIGA